MFTGIIEDVGRVVELRRSAGGGRLVLETALELGDIASGASIAVDGACLTVAALEPRRLSFDLSAETLSRTTLGELRASDPVHLERALKFGGRLDGHLVTGHIDGVGRLVSRREQGQVLELEFEAPPEAAGLLVPKGSVAVAGVSLTVNQPSGSRFWVALVPQTLERTHLGRLRPGGPVNIEADIIGKYVRRFVGSPGGIDEAFLREHGFI